VVAGQALLAETQIPQLLHESLAMAAMVLPQQLQAQPSQELVEEEEVAITHRGKQSLLVA
jgi:hypothetical protein